jgi:hypothetical protein
MPMGKMINFTITTVISTLLFIGNSNLAGAETLTMMEKDGLPVPTQATQYIAGHALFIALAHFDVNSPPEAVVPLYNAEFLKRGWKVEPIEQSPDHMVLHFTTPKGPGTLDVVNSGYSIVELSITDQVAAAKSPLAPKPGMVTVLFSNETKKAVNISVGAKSIKVAAGATSPFTKASGLEVAPGKLHIKTKKMVDDFDAIPGQIWLIKISDGFLLSSKQN